MYDVGGRHFGTVDRRATESAHGACKPRGTHPGRNLACLFCRAVSIAILGESVSVSLEGEKKK